MHLTERIAERSPTHVTRHISANLPTLEAEKELVIYRVAQEALTNVLRHAQAERVLVEVGPDNGSVLLRVEDDGCGPGSTENGGIKGMRERAILVGADLAIEPRPGGGTIVRLAVPAE